MIRNSRLSCGIDLVTEQMPGVASATLGYWVGTGSRDETPAQSGISHFLEHLLFKGTPTRSAKSIANAIDAVGGDMNAYTTKEYTVFYTRTLGEDLELGLNVLSDIMSEPAFRQDEVDAERQVILEEVLMHLDEPSDVVHERFAEAMFTGHPLGREVLGIPEIIMSVTVPEIRSFFEHHYRPGNIVVAAAGAVDHDQLAEEIEKRFASSSVGTPPERSAPGPSAAMIDVTHKESEQAHLVLGVRSVDRHSADRYALTLMNFALGGGMSSRLFQKVREERGLCYSISSDRVAFADAGALAVSVGTAPDHAHEVLDIVIEELNTMAAGGVTDEELALAKGHLKADTVLSFEDSGSRMSRIGASQLLHGEVLSIDELTKKFNAVTREEIAEVAQRVLANNRILAVVGPFDDDEFNSAVAQR